MPKANCVSDPSSVIRMLAIEYDGDCERYDPNMRRKDRKALLDSGKSIWLMPRPITVFRNDVIAYIKYIARQVRLYIPHI